MTLNDSYESIKNSENSRSGYLSQSRVKLDGLLFKSEYSPLTPQVTVPAAKYEYLPRKKKPETPISNTATKNMDILFLLNFLTEFILALRHQGHIITLWKKR